MPQTKIKAGIKAVKNYKQFDDIVDVFNNIGNKIYMRLKVDIKIY